MAPQANNYFGYYSMDDIALEYISDWNNLLNPLPENIPVHTSLATEQSVWGFPPTENWELEIANDPHPPFFLHLNTNSTVYNMQNFQFTWTTTSI